MIIATVLIATTLLPGEERSWALRTADLVVVGNLKLSSYFLWFDGIHIYGSIVPREILYGPAQSGITLQYSDIIPCSLGKCDYRFVWSSWSSQKDRVVQRGVWLLWRGPAKSWTGRRWDTGFRELDYRGYALKILSERKQQEIGHYPALGQAPAAPTLPCKAAAP
jgi:hypothetical protein